MCSRYLKLLFFVLLLGCKTSQIPKESLPAFNPVRISSETVNDSLKLKITNRIKSPVQITISADDSVLSRKIKPVQTVILQAEQDSLLSPALTAEELEKLEFGAGLGDPQKKVKSTDVGLPIPKNKAVRIIQGHGGTYSHDHVHSRYAIDFSLKVGDTIFAALDGYAVLVTEGYTRGGKDIRWLDFGNKIMIYNPETGLFFQYSHLAHQGAFVEVGDWVEQGQPIGLSGMTGYTDIPHLHFNVLVPEVGKTELVSVPVDFIEGYLGKDLKKNVVIKRN